MGGQENEGMEKPDYTGENMITILQGDCLEHLRALPDCYVQCCVTSPPYWGLRDYGVAGQLGLEKTPAEYVAKMVEVFREVRRVLKDDGTLWLNLGDSYAAKRSGTHQPAETLAGGNGGKMEDGSIVNRGRHAGYNPTRNASAIGLKHKDLIGIPWRVAFALQADGWYLRQDIIWHKPNPMPESVTDRCTKAHEYIFLMSKRERYYYDSDAIKEPVLLSSLERAEDGVMFGGQKQCPDTRLQSGKVWVPKQEGKNSRINVSKDPAHAHEYNGKNRSQEKQHSSRRMFENVKAARESGAHHDTPFGVTRNKRSVWTIATSPYKAAHFATFPPDLIKPCILAGTKPGDTVLDPFGGSGTTGKVAIEFGRKAILIELNPAYCKLILQRTNVTPGLALA